MQLVSQNRLLELELGQEINSEISILIEAITDHKGLRRNPVSQKMVKTDLKSPKQSQYINHIMMAQLVAERAVSSLRMIYL